MAPKSVSTGGVNIDLHSLTGWDDSQWRTQDSDRRGLDNASLHPPDSQDVTELHKIPPPEHAVTPTWESIGESGENTIYSRFP